MRNENKEERRAERKREREGNRWVFNHEWGSAQVQICSISWTVTKVNTSFAALRLPSKHWVSATARCLRRETPDSWTCSNKSVIMWRQKVLARFYWVSNTFFQFSADGICITLAFVVYPRCVLELFRRFGKHLQHTKLFTSYNAMVNVVALPASEKKTGQHSKLFLSYFGGHWRSICIMLDIFLYFFLPSPLSFCLFLPSSPSFLVYVLLSLLLLINFSKQV